MFFRNKSKLFEVHVLQHLDAGYNLAYWLLTSEADAKDAVQTASVRALTYIDSMRHETAKAWFLGIVRNCCVDLLNERTGRIKDVDVDGLIDEHDELEVLGANTLLPEHLLLNKEYRAIVNQTLAKLPIAYKEVLILREMEDLAYDQIAIVMNIPIGTVMSRLSRAKASFKKEFLGLLEGKST